MTILDTIYAYGHKNILCTHNTTLELTKDTFLTKRGNCILGVNASKACIDLNPDLKKLIKSGHKIKVIIKTKDKLDSFIGYGNKRLTLSHKKNIVFRKSNFICDRTVLINCSKSSRELNRDLINELKDSGEKISIIFEIDDSDGN